MKKIGVLTSGGDAPGMNACIRAVVRQALSHGIETIGVRRGYAGLVAGDAEPLPSRLVGGIARWGGTILQTARSEEFMTPEGFGRALDSISRLGIEGLVVIGGDGSMQGALALHNAGVKCVGVPGSIDNDMCGTSLAIGVDTAMDTILEAIDKIKDTASATERAFVIEVMGRQSGYLALAAGVAGGAEMVIVPEQDITIEDILKRMTDARTRGKPHFIVVVAEGAKLSSTTICDAISRAEHPRFEARLTVLGHVQRGGSPSAFDRLFSTRLGAAAVEALLAGKSGIMVGAQPFGLSHVALEEVPCRDRPADPDLLELANMVAL